jgi:unsaturated rhamnogalacturonyl hydrolase
MKSNLTGIAGSLAIAVLFLTQTGKAQPAAPVVLTSAGILAQAQATTDAQLQSLAAQKRNPTDWIGGTMWIGISEFSHVSQRPPDADAVWRMGEKVGWKQLPKVKDPFHADNDCIGQSFLDVYARTRDPKTIAPLRSYLDTLVDHLSATVNDRKLTWWWCDALFMAPGVLARTSDLTGDAKYTDAMDKEWWRVSDALYDPEEHLFFRDARFLTMKTKGGKKVFWSRGNGWVFGGLVRVLSAMPANYPTRPKYEAQFRDMAAKLLSLQGKDGAWRTSLLDADEYPLPETSGTAFYCYGFAWGINNGLLPRETYAPAAVKAWTILMANRRADNLPGWVQKVGDRPGIAGANDTQLYTTGSIDLAATEMMKLASSGAPLTIPAS